MCSFPKTLLLFAAILCFAAPINAQDLKHLIEIAHYRLRSSTQDQNGNLDSMELDNAPIDPG